jgi:hypothetical protein
VYTTPEMPAQSAESKYNTTVWREILIPARNAAA